MRITRVTIQRQLIIASLNTKVKGSQSQIMNNNTTKWPRGSPRDILKAFLESFLHTKTPQVMQVPTKCTQNAACKTSREATSNNTIAVTARTTFNDQETHLLRLRWVQSWRNQWLLSVLLESCGCWGGELMLLVRLWQKDYSSERWDEVRIGKWLCLFKVLHISMPIWLELMSSLQLKFECFTLRTACSWQYEVKHGVKR